MKNVLKTMTMAGVASVIAVAAFANNPKHIDASISNLPASGYVNVGGTVQSLDGANRATLRDSNGSTVKVVLNSTDYSSLRVGEPVRVSGSVLSTTSGREIMAINNKTRNVNTSDSMGDGAAPYWR